MPASVLNRPARTLPEGARLIALAPDLDRSYEQLYGYLNDDVSRRLA